MNPISFSFEKETLFPILAAMQPLCTRRTTVEATTNILLQISNRELIVKGTDLEISLQSSCQLIDSNAMEPQSILIPGRRFYEVVKELDGTITCAFENNQLAITTPSVELRLNVRDSDEFPPFPERIENLISFDTTDTIELLNSVSFLIPQNNSNPALNGLLIEVDSQSVSFTSTDGHRLAQAKNTKYQLEERQTWLIPRRAAYEIKKIIESVSDQTLFFGTCNGHLVISGTQFNFFTRLIAQPFPEYRPILSTEGFFCGTVQRTSFIKALRHTMPLLSGQFIATNFTFRPETLELIFSNKGVGTLQEEVPLIKGPKEPISIRFYAPYLVDGLQACTKEHVNFFIKSSQKPLIIEESTEHFTILYLVMPVSSNNQ